MVAELLWIIAVAGALLGLGGASAWRSSRSRVARAELRLAECERLRIELLRQNGELRQHLEVLRKTAAAMPRPAASRTRAATADERSLPDEPPRAPRAPATWQDTLPVVSEPTTAPTPFMHTDPGPLLGRVRG